MALWEEETGFPRSSESTRSTLTAQLTEYVSRLHGDPSCPGAVFHPKEKDNNMGGDFYGLFKCLTAQSDYVLMVGSCKDWFSHTIGKGTVDLGQVWRESQAEEFLGKGNPVVVEVGGVAVTVQVVFMLFTPNNLLGDVKLGLAEGVVTVASMRRWLPSAAYACETAHHLREIFSPVSDLSER